MVVPLLIYTGAFRRPERDAAPARASWCWLFAPTKLPAGRVASARSMGCRASRVYALSCVYHRVCSPSPIRADSKPP